MPQPEDAEPYSHVLDASHRPAEVLAAVVAMIEEDSV